jgi:hypothetical protein
VRDPAVLAVPDMLHHDFAHDETSTAAPLGNVTSAVD